MRRGACEMSITGGRMVLRFNDKLTYIVLWTAMALCYILALVSFSFAMHWYEITLKDRFMMISTELIENEEVIEAISQNVNDTIMINEIIAFVTTFNLSFTSLIISMLIFSFYKVKT